MKTSKFPIGSFTFVLFVCVGSINVSAQSSAPSVDLTSDAFTTPPTTGEHVRFLATASGGVSPYLYEWDLDGDGAIDRSSAEPSIQATYPRAGTFAVSVTVSDADGQPNTRSGALTVRGPRLAIETVGDLLRPTIINPGDQTVGQMVRLTNIGDATQPGGFAMFVPTASPTPMGHDKTIAVSPLRLLVETSPAAIVRQALVPLPELQAGESIELFVGITVDQRASCGQYIGVDFLGATWAGGQFFEVSKVIDTQVADACVPPSVGPIGVPPGLPPPPARRTGLYFNASRPGNGMFNYFRPTGSTGFLSSIYTESFAGAWYTGLNDRTPVWYTLDGKLVGGTGELLMRKFINQAAPDGFTPTSEIAGRAWTSRLDTSEIVFAWQLSDGSGGIEIMQAGPLLFSGDNHTQSWFAESEPGWGLAIETLVSGGVLEFFGAFVYDDAGNPRWVVGDIAGSSGGQVSLTGFRPHCPACPWIVDWNSDAAPAGSLQIEYASEILGRLDTAIALPTAYGGVWLRADLDIGPVGVPASASE